MGGNPNLRVDRNKRHGKDGRKQPSAPVSLRIERTVSSRCASLSCNTNGQLPAKNAVCPSVRVALLPVKKPAAFGRHTPGVMDTIACHRRHTAG